MVRSFLVVTYALNHFSLQCYARYAWFESLHQYSPSSRSKVRRGKPLLFAWSLLHNLTVVV